MEASRVCRRRLFAPLLIGLLFAPRAAADEPWRPLLPDGWLGFAAARDLEATEAKLGRLLDTLSFDYRGLLGQLKRAVGAEDLAPGAGDTVVGFARAGDGAVFPFALLPTDSFDDLVASIGGELTGEVGVVTIAGLEVCLAPAGGWAFVAALDRLDVARGASKRAVDFQAAESSKNVEPNRDVVVELSAAGIEHLARRASEVDPRVRRRTLRLGDRWPPPLAAFDAAVLQNLPLLTQLSERCDSIRVEATAGSGGDLKIALSVGLLDTRSLGDRLPASTTAGFDSAASIVRLVGSGEGLLASVLAELNLAYARGRPDEVDAKQYPPEAYAAFMESTLAAFKLVDHFDFRLLHRPEAAPIDANRAAILTVADRDQFLERFTEMMRSWNQLVRASDAKIRVLFDVEEIERGAARGLAFSVDMVEAINAGGLLEVRELMQRLYGDGGRYTWRLIPIDGSRVLLSDLPQQDAERIADEIGEAGESPGATTDATTDWQAAIHVEHLLEWRRRSYQALQPDLAKRKALKPMTPAPPVTARATVEGSRLTIEATAPPELLRALGDYLRVNR